MTMTRCRTTPRVMNPAQWMLLDYGCAVLHVFMPEAPKFYNLENLWKDGTPVTLKSWASRDK